MHRRLVHLLLALMASTTLAAHENDGGTAAPASTPALSEILTAADGRSQRWTQVPELVVITSVLVYHADGPSTYMATSERLSDLEVEQLVVDLTTGLTALTGTANSRFSAVERERPVEGLPVSVLRRGQIVVARFRGVRALTQTIGLGGRTNRVDGSITGAAVMLDSDFDRTSAKRWLLRTHELGHALGLNHVRSAESIMNPTIGPEPTSFDRTAAAMILPAAFYTAAE